MKIAAAEALVYLMKERVPHCVLEATPGRSMLQFVIGPDYIVPNPFDLHLLYEVPIAVAKAAMATGVATREVKDVDFSYRASLAIRMGRYKPLAPEDDLHYGKVHEVGHFDNYHKL